MTLKAFKKSAPFSSAAGLRLALPAVLGLASAVLAQSTEHGEAAGATLATGNASAWIAMAAALTMAVSCLAAGYAVAKIGAAAMGAASEKPEIMGKAMLFVAIAEGIAIYGLIVAVFILTKI